MLNFFGFSGKTTQTSLFAWNVECIWLELTILTLKLLEWIFLLLFGWFGGITESKYQKISLTLSGKGSIFCLYNNHKFILYHYVIVYILNSSFQSNEMINNFWTPDFYIYDLLKFKLLDIMNSIQGAMYITSKGIEETGRVFQAFF